MTNTQETDKSKLCRQFSSLQGVLPPAGDGKRILFWRSPGGVEPSTAIETVFAVALRLRGHNPSFVTCDGILSGCLLQQLSSGAMPDDWSEQCLSCAPTGRGLQDAVGIPVTPSSRLVDEDTRAALCHKAMSMPLDAIQGHQWKGVQVGKLALSSTMRYLGGFIVGETDPLYEKALREYFFSALANTVAAENALRMFAPERVVMQGSIYVDWGAMFQLCLRAGVPVTRWERGFVLDRLILRNADGEAPHLYTVGDQTWAHLVETGLNQEEERQLKEYFALRTSGVKSQHLLFTEKPIEKRAFVERFNLDPAKPTWVVFPHLGWDAAFALQGLQFSSQIDWLLETMRTIRDLGNVNWMVKVHPSEHRLGTVKGVAEILREAFPDLDEFVTVIPSNEGINTYGMFPLIDGGITCMGTTGLEMAAHGKPVILAENAHYSNKGFTVDSPTPEAYFEHLHQAGGMEALSAEQVRRARVYSYTYFLARQLHFKPIEHYDNLTFDSFEDLGPGKDPVIDLICDRIVHGGEFIHTPERSGGGMMTSVRQGGSPRHVTGSF